jgi:hypothetical protein
MLVTSTSYTEMRCTRCVTERVNDPFVLSDGCIDQTTPEGLDNWCRKPLHSATTNDTNPAQRMALFPPETRHQILAGCKASQTSITPVYKSCTSIAYGNPNIWSHIRTTSALSSRLSPFPSETSTVLEMAVHPRRWKRRDLKIRCRLRNLCQLSSPYTNHPRQRILESLTLKTLYSSQPRF